MPHPLHRALGHALARCLDAYPWVRLVLDPACGGTHNLPLFLANKRSLPTECCNVDALVVGDGAVKVVLEIEEANVRPTHLCGKFLTAALATCHIHDTVPQPVRLASSTAFVQVVDTSKLDLARTAKVEQFREIEAGINGLLPFRNEAIRIYRIFSGERRC